MEDHLRAVLDRASHTAATDERVVAAWVGGSLAAGAADAYSDVDLHLLVEDEDLGWFGEHWAEFVQRISGPLVLASPLPGVVGGYTLNRDWLHVDLVVHGRRDFEASHAGPTLPIHNPEGLLLEAGPSTGLHPPGEPFYPVDVVQLYLYFLGNLVVTFGRGELIVARGGVQALTNLLVRLMLAERGIRETGGQKRLNPYLSAEQRRVLESVPAVSTSQADITTAVEHLTSDFVRRARALASATGGSWPQQLHEATLAHLQRHLDTDLAAD